MSFRGPKLVIPQQQAVNLWMMEKLPNEFAKRHKRNPSICIGDTDLWITHDTNKTTARRTDRHMRYYMRVEIKTMGAARSDWQEQLDSDLDLLARTDWVALRTAAGTFAKGRPQNFREVKAADGALIRFMGSHLLQLSNETPANSDWISWDAKIITFDQMVDVLNYEIHPDTLQLMNFDDPMHKPRIQDTLPGMG